MAGSLFDRLTKGASGAKMDDDESIRLNIERMFTTRQGSASTVEDYGLPDLNDLTLSKAELAEKNCQAMTACIRKYEPRLSHATVTEKRIEGFHFTQVFIVTGERPDAAGNLSPWRLEVKLADGKVIR